VASSDFLRRGTLLDGQVRVAHTVTTALAAEAVRLHDLEPVAAHCLARALTCGALFSPLLGDDERVTLRWKYEGALDSIIVETGNTADLRGTIQPGDLHTADDPAILYGDGGTIAIIRSDSRGQRSSVSEASLLDITDDLSFSFVASDQIETEIVVLVAFNADPENPVALCQGVLLQAMPGCDLEQFEQLRKGLRSSQTRDLLGQMPNLDAPSDAIRLCLPLNARRYAPAMRRSTWSVTSAPPATPSSPRKSRPKPVAKPDPAQVSIPRWRFSCTACGNCCRRWHVAVGPDEVARLKSLEWLEEDAVGEKITTRIKGFEYLAHEDDGACVYLDTETNLCKIHKRFGFDAKPKGCRIYPLNIATTFQGEYSVIPRLDCPGARENAGKPLERNVRQIRSYVEELGLDGGFEKFQLDDFDKKTLVDVTASLFKHVLSSDQMRFPEKAQVLLGASHRLQRLGPVFLREDLETVAPTFYPRILTDLREQKLRRLYTFERWRFLSVLISFLRRDEEMIGKGASARLARSVTTARIFFGKARLRGLGSEHPDTPLNTRILFTKSIANLDSVDWRIVSSLFRLRIQSYQFFGSTMYYQSYFQGLRSLLFAFPLILAAAKWSALARDPERCELRDEDLDYAVGVIDHSLGRSALLGSMLYKVLVKQMADWDPYCKLVDALLHGTEE
jgi:redox-regulated HSP33 family molecular chaperone/Fe-S-cluster containining protein